MYGPYQLTRIIYILIVVVLIAVFSYAIVYTRKVKARQKRLSKDGIVRDTPGSIAAATESLSRDK